MKTLKTDQELMRVLDLKRVNRLICGTDKGNLELCLRRGEKEYFLMHDAVPLEKEKNAEIMKLLFEIPQPIIQKINSNDTKYLKKPLGRPKKAPLLVK